MTTAPKPVQLGETRRLDQLRELLVSEGYERLAKPRVFLEFTGVKEADSLLNDIDGHPHFFVFACLADRQVPSEKASLLPFELGKRRGSFDFSSLTKLSRQQIEEAMLAPPPLHRFPTVMAGILYSAILRIDCEYKGNAAAIWTGRPSSATVVRRFLEFEGAGQKIATMAANILVRDFRIDVSDRYSIDISVDVHVRRVFTRLGFVPANASPEYVIYRARELHPEYPGVFDVVLWELGRTLCLPKQPMCERCAWAQFCSYPNSDPNGGSRP